jgi:hypothetical protein
MCRADLDDGRRKSAIRDRALDHRARGGEWKRHGASTANHR